MQQKLRATLALALDRDEWSYIRSENVHARKTRRQAVLLWLHVLSHFDWR